MAVPGDEAKAPKCADGSEGSSGVPRLLAENLGTRLTRDGKIVSAGAHNSSGRMTCISAALSRGGVPLSIPLAYLSLGRTAEAAGTVPKAVAWIAGAGGGFHAGAGGYKRATGGTGSASPFERTS